MALRFDAIDDYVDCGNRVTINNLKSGLTIIVWVKVSSNGENGNGRIYAKRGTAGTGPQLFLSGLATAPDVAFGHTGSGTEFLVETSTTLSLNIWTAIACTWTGSSTADKNCRIYFNLSEASYIIQQNGTLTLGDDSANTWTIGNRDPGLLNRTFDGAIAYMQIFNRVLEFGEIRMATRVPGSVRNSLVAYWPLNGLSSPEPDYSSFLSNGTVSGAVFTSNPPVGRNARLARRNQFIKTTQVTSNAYTKDLSLALILTESKAIDFLKVLSQALTLTESKTLDTLKGLSQSLTLTESNAKDILKVLTHSMTLAESKAADFLKVLSQSMTLTESQVKDYLKALSNAMTLTESNSKDFLKVLTQNLTLTESQAKDFIKVLTHAMTVTESQSLTLIVAILALYNFLARGNIETHDKIAMRHDLALTGIAKQDVQEMEIDTDRLNWDFDNNQ